MAVKSPLPLGWAGCRSPPQDTRGGTFWRAAGTLDRSGLSPLGTPFPGLGSGKTREGPPKIHLTTGGGGCCWGRQGRTAHGRAVHHPGGDGSAPRPPAVAARAPRYSPLREGSGAERWEGPVPRQVPAPRRSCFICTAPRSDWPGRLPSRDRPPQLPKNSPDPPRPPQPRAPLPRGCGTPAPSASPEGRPRGGRGEG